MRFFYCLNLDLNQFNYLVSTQLHRVHLFCQKAHMRPSSHSKAQW